MFRLFLDQLRTSPTGFWFWIGESAVFSLSFWLLFTKSEARLKEYRHCGWRYVKNREVQTYLGVGEAALNHNGALASIAIKHAFRIAFDEWKKAHPQCACYDIHPLADRGYIEGGEDFELFALFIWDHDLEPSKLEKHSTSEVLKQLNACFEYVVKTTIKLQGQSSLKYFFSSYGSCSVRHRNKRKAEIIDALSQQG